MPKTIRDLLVKVGVKSDTGQLTSLNKKLGMTTQTARRLGVAMAAVGAAITGATIHFAKAGAEAEKSQVAFETMTGSMEKANQIMKQMEEFALETPFSFPEVEKNVKLLKAMGIETNNLFSTMRSLGDVAAGLNVPLERIALNFGQVRAQGKLTGREMRDFAVAGVPIREMLSKNLGVPMAQISDLMAKGQISFQDVRKAFEDMAGPGGQFNNLMVKMSKTMGGVVSNLGVMWSLLSRDIGKQINKDLAPVINELFEFLKENRAVIAKRISGALKAIIVSVKELAGFVFKFRKAFAFAAMLGGLAALGKAVTMLAGAFTMLGNASLIAWLKGLGPLILIGAAAAALVLIIEDIWTAFTNPEAESAFKILLKKFELWKAFRRVIDITKDAFRGLLNLFFKGFEGVKNLMDSAIKTFMDFKNLISDAFDFGSKLLSGKIDLGMSPTPAMAGFTAPNPMNFGTMNVPVNLNVNVAGTNATPGQIGAAAKNGVQEAIKSANNNTAQRVK